MRRLGLFVISILLTLGFLPAYAQDTTPEATEMADMADTRHYVNNIIGFQMMLPETWWVRDFGTTIEVATEPDDPTSTVLHISLTPVEFFEGGTIEGTPVAKIPLEEYAGFALAYEVGGAGTLTIQDVQPFETTTGQQGYLAIWEYAMTPLDNTAGTPVPGETEILTIPAAYFELEEGEINGQTYRALEFTTGNPELTDMFHSLLNTVVIGKLDADDAFFGSLHEAVNAYLDRQGSTISEAIVQPEIVDGDYVRFALVTTEDATSNAGLGFARRVGESWEVVSVGTAFTPDFFTEHNIPTSLIPPSTS
jgi:hypothetical protein